MKKLFPYFYIFLFASCSNFNYETDVVPQLVPFDQTNSDLPVVNIVTEQADFDHLLATPEEEIEIAGKFNLYRNQLLVVENQPIEMEVKGSFSLRFTLKSLGIKFDKKYDNADRSLINPRQILEHHNLDKIKAIRLRNSGSDFTNTMLKDLSMTQLAIQANLGLDLAYGEPVLVYINEAFYGLMNLRTEANTNGMVGLYDAKKKDITLAKITTKAFIKKDGDFARIDAFVQAINDQNTAYLKEEIDLQNFIVYMIFESYLGNTDWPHNNARFYAIKDGKFRFILFDLDKVAWLKMDKSPIHIITKQFPKNILSDLFSTLYEDSAFKQAFDKRYLLLMQEGTISYEKFKPIVDRNAALIKSAIPLQVAKHQAPKSSMDWEIELDKMLLLFEERASVVETFIGNK